MKTLNRLSDTLPKNQNGSTGLPLCSEVVLFMGKNKSINYIGAWYSDVLKKYECRIVHNGKRIYLGVFQNAIDAAKAYDKKATELGIKRRLNFPDPEPENNIPNTRLIRLSTGEFSIVDAEDFDRVNSFNWSGKTQRTSTYQCYAICRIENIWLHRLILGITDRNIQVDHIDHNGLNNQKSNLRACTSSQNCMNTRKAKNKTSKYKGVSFCALKNNYKVSITIKGKWMHLGYFKKEIDAALEYDNKAKEYFGEFAFLNFPDHDKI